jgi:hypothetical protein
VHPLVKELEAYKKIVKEWNKKPGNKSECMQFLIDRAKKFANEL